MQNSVLYVIGNGFDLHHRVASDLNSFRQFVREKNCQVYDAAMKHIFAENEDLWTCFEEQLGSLDVEQILDEAYPFLQSYGADEWSESGHHDFKYEIDKVLEDLSNGLHSEFCQWIRSLRIPSREQACEQLLNICAESGFLSFNYTNTLERIYGVHQNKILHLHGRGELSANQIIIGHRGGKHSLNDDVDFDAADPRFVEGNVSIDDYFRDTSKPVDQVIQRNSLFFNCLSEISDIVVLGHSFGPIDMPYFQEIARNTRPDANWSASVHSDADSLAVDAASQLLFTKVGEIRQFSLHDMLRDR